MTADNTQQEQKVYASSFSDKHLHLGLNSLSQAQERFYSSMRCWAVSTGGVVSGAAGSVQSVTDVQGRRSCFWASLSSSFCPFRKKLSQQNQSECLLLSES